MTSKNMLNSNFGCCVQKHNDENLSYVRYSGEWKKESIPYEQKNSEFLLYQVGVFITAYARMELLQAVYAIWQDDAKNGRRSAIVYMDTDSCKYLYRGGIYEHLFDKLDENIEYMTKSACEYYGFEMDDSLKKLGKWDLETKKYDEKFSRETYTYKTFITLGSKRYLPDGEPTVSGLPKQGFYDFCKIKNLTPEEAFRCGTYFPPEIINKVAMTYTTTNKQYNITNDGETWVTPRHFVHAQNVGFNLDISKSYRQFLEMKHVETGKRGN